MENELKIWKFTSYYGNETIVVAENFEVACLLLQIKYHLQTPMEVSTSKNLVRWGEDAYVVDSYDIVEGVLE